MVGGDRIGVGNRVGVGDKVGIRDHHPKGSLPVRPHFRDCQGGRGGKRCHTVSPVTLCSRDTGSIIFG